MTVVRPWVPQPPARAEARVRELVDPKQREPEIEVRAQARTEELYRTRAFKAIVGEASATEPSQ
jgi:hypothetical protein